MMVGPPCSLFVFMSSSYHHRSIEMPYGDQSKAKIRVCNQLITNLIVILCVAQSRGVMFLMLGKPVCLHS